MAHLSDHAHVKSVVSLSHPAIVHDANRIRSIGLCSVLDDDQLGMLHHLSKSVEYAVGTTLFLQDDDADFIFNITSGSVRVYRSLQDGQRQIVGFAIPGDFLGLSMSEHNAFSADAITSTTTCKFSRQAFSDMLDDHPEILRLVLRMTSHELSLAQDQMVIMGCHTALQKVAAFLIGLRHRWTSISGATVNIPLPMTRHDIADFLGISIETVSRGLSSLARDKMILIVPDGVRLLDIRRLELLSRH